MRCKPGDLAFVVRGRNIGRLVLVLGPAWVPGCDWDVEMQGGPGFTTNGLGERSTRVVAAIKDSKLRPIRPHGGHDETLTWAGKPQETYLEALKSVLRERVKQ